MGRINNLLTDRADIGLCLTQYLWSSFSPILDHIYCLWMNLHENAFRTNNTISRDKSQILLCLVPVRLSPRPIPFGDVTELTFNKALAFSLRPRVTATKYLGLGTRQDFSSNKIYKGYFHVIAIYHIFCCLFALKERPIWCS